MYIEYTYVTWSHACAQIGSKNQMYEYKQITVLFVHTNPIRSHLSIPGRVGLKRRQGARARLEHVLDGGFLGWPLPGEPLLWLESNVQTAENTMSLTTQTAPPCSTTSSRHLYLLQNLQVKPAFNMKSLFLLLRVFFTESAKCYIFG